MRDTSLIRVLILAGADLAHRWELALRGPTTQIWLGRDAIPLGEHPEIIVTNSHAELAVPRDAVGIIQIGGRGPADVLLPENCPPSEIQLACRLLIEIVRLRQRERVATETQRTLSLAAMTDSLTSLPNRRAWEQALAERIAEMASGGLRLCMAMFDIHEFKEINDTHGHVVGDKVLQAVGRAIQEQLRRGDFVARLGGDEFGLLLSVPSEAEAAAIVERVRSRIATASAESTNLSVSANVGFALTGSTISIDTAIDMAIDTAASLYRAADAALIAAKRAGKRAFQVEDRQK